MEGKERAGSIGRAMSIRRTVFELLSWAYRNSLAHSLTNSLTCNVWGVSPHSSLLEKKREKS